MSTLETHKILENSFKRMVGCGADDGISDSRSASMVGMCVGWTKKGANCKPFVLIFPVSADICEPFRWHLRRYECGAIGTSNVDHTCRLHSMSIIHIYDMRASSTWNGSFNRALRICCHRRTNTNLTQT